MHPLEEACREASEAEHREHNQAPATALLLEAAAPQVAREQARCVVRHRELEVAGLRGGRAGSRLHVLRLFTVFTVRGVHSGATVLEATKSPLKSPLARSALENVSVDAD